MGLTKNLQPWEFVSIDRYRDLKRVTATSLLCKAVLPNWYSVDPSIRLPPGPLPSTRISSLDLAVRKLSSQILPHNSQVNRSKNYYTIPMSSSGYILRGLLVLRAGIIISVEGNSDAMWGIASWKKNMFYTVAKVHSPLVFDLKNKSGKVLKRIQISDRFHPSPPPWFTPLIPLV